MTTTERVALGMQLAALCMAGSEHFLLEVIRAGFSTLRT